MQDFLISIPSSSTALTNRDRSKIDVLANVAGVMDAYEAADVITDQEWERVMTVNLTVPTRMIRAVLPFMKAKKNGSIINVASKAAVSGAAAGVAYTTSKHGLVSTLEVRAEANTDTK
jgi:NAD(P)-dependent dehydrogenase (short-subunit alcohol dehydrogenase family)